MTPNVEFIGAEPLDADGINQILCELGGSWTQLTVLPTVDSTNTELARDISAVLTGSVQILAAEEQTDGLGRLGRTWSSLFGKGIAMSIGVAAEDVLVEPEALPLLVGLAVIRALNANAVSANLKWPNDVVFEDANGSIRKCGGILVQRVKHAYVIGIGINVSHQLDELPTQTSTSLLLEGFDISRNELTARIINKVESVLLQPASWLDEYSSVCSSIGREVVVHQLLGEQIEGKAISISPSGALVLVTDDAEVEITIGDVEHATIT